jgi:hypothetical protein
VHHLWCWITNNANTITAIAALIAAIATVAYLIATVLIFRETKKSADAADRSAAAASTSATAAAQTANLMRQQFEEQAALGDFIVEVTIDSAITALEQIQHHQDFSGNLAILDSVLRQQPEKAINHAARRSREAANLLASALHLLRIADTYLVSLTEFERQNANRASSGFSLLITRNDGILKDALGKLLNAQSKYRTALTPAHSTP